MRSSAEPGKLSETPYETIPRLVGPLSKEVLSCVPLAYDLRGKYHSVGHPSISLRSHSFQFILGEPTRGLAGIYFIYTFILSLSRLYY